MVEIKVVKVEIPVAESMRKVADIVALTKEKEYTERQKEQIERGWESMPHLISFISSEIQKASQNGCHKIELNLIDDTFKNRTIDPRINYTFDGLFIDKMASHITEIFKSAGYWGGAYPKADVGGMCYRNGVIKFSWD